MRGTSYIIHSVLKKSYIQPRRQFTSRAMFAVMCAGVFAYVYANQGSLLQWLKELVQCLS